MIFRHSLTTFTFLLTLSAVAHAADPTAPAPSKPAAPAAAVKPAAAKPAAPAPAAKPAPAVAPVIAPAAPAVAPTAPAAPAPAAPHASLVLSPATCTLDTLKQELDIDKLSPAAAGDVCDRGGDFLTSVNQVCPQVVASVLAPTARLCDGQGVSAEEAKLLARVELVVDAHRRLAGAGRGSSDSKGPTRIGNQGVGASTPASVFAQGVGDFLTSRAEQEVSAYATVELFNRLCDSDVGFALPATCKLLDEQDHGASPIGLGVLRRVVTNDLQKLPTSLIVHGLKKAKTDEQRAAVCAGDVAFAFGNALRLKVDIGKVLGEGNLRKYAAPATETAACTGLWNIVNAALKGVVDPKLALAGSWGVGGASRGVVGTPLAPIADALLELAAAVRELVDEKDAQRAQELRLVVVEKAVAVAKLLTPGHDALLDDVQQVAGPLWNKDWSGAAAAVASAQTLGQAILCGGETKECKTDKNIRLIIGVAADIAEARDSAAVQSALNRVAEPIGSWRRKFQDSFTLSLNGFAGIKVGYEQIKGSTPEGGYVAPFLPLGLETSFAGDYWWGMHLGLFFQVVDVGNVASVHLATKDESGLTKVHADPDLTVLQLFAPGAYLMWAPFKSPFVIGAGASWVPALRETGEGRHSAFQVGATLAVDVPVLELVHL